MSTTIKYKVEIKTVPFGDGTIQVKNLTPIFSPKERENQRREIEVRLFDVFSKYENKR